MASIVKRKKKYSVVYTYTDENGNKRQKWETFETNSEAKKRKLQVEYEQESGTFIPPSAKTVNDLLDEYMSIYGVNTWAMSTYESRKSLIANYCLRHSSITYKLKLNGGDMKSVQGDSGHAQVKMVADVYSHIIDDDRRLNAERMEAAFYSGRQATPEPVQPAATESSADDKELLLKLLQNPEMAALLKSLAKTL
mgnify:CR=1 FL=1